MSSRHAYINLAVADLARAAAFYEAIGLHADLSGGPSAQMPIGDGATVMLHTREFFEQFTGSDLPDLSTTREVAVGLSAESRDEVDALTAAAVAAGGIDVGAQDQGWMYMRAFRDIDGHQWSVIHIAAG